MKKGEKKPEIRLVVLNPECLDKASRKFTELMYKSFNAEFSEFLAQKGIEINSNHIDENLYEEFIQSRRNKNELKKAQ